MSARGNTSSLSGDKKKPLNINAPSEDELASMLLADLQQKQDEELQQVGIKYRESIVGHHVGLMGWSIVPAWRLTIGF